jgi:cyclopropane-fatty-acyl-phospholipid synthase
VLRGQIEQAGLTWRAAHGFGPHYARTLAEWQDRFQSAWTEIAPMGFDARFKRMWELYLYYCEAGFKVGTIDVMQVSVVRD